MGFLSLLDISNFFLHNNVCSNITYHIISEDYVYYQVQTKVIIIVLTVRSVVSQI